ncbi:MAG: NAD(P)-binding protein [Humidesulfovibrio sp.]|uniref:protoporphyrinogen/coproporphyrinogen oxidase n=1 Tax=Humidesulfovibrio sp. TaxID=2910988 RepID=UPI002732D20C|nr:NAD(P)-binding protein [Humidesulfovibrio sp.]MDP2847086.1 NAD(P)-binding protein [Humidesulfovibrio sp.]
MQVDYAIIGAGPTGLGAARRLTELGCRSFVVLEKNAYAGGLAASFKDPQGYTWDIGGHVAFSHYEYFDRLLDDLLGDGQLHHQRKAWVRACQSWVPYPFQNNIRHLPKDARWECVKGLLPGNRPDGPPENFRQWIHGVFGEGIGNVFLWPYNFKVWAIDPAHMSTSWVGERVSIVGLETVLKNIILELDEHGWGPNRTFAFPASGGTGEIFRRMALPLAEHIRYGCGAARVDSKAKTLITDSGEEITYGALLNTAPLDLLITNQLSSPPDAMVAAAKLLKHNGVYVTGVGARGRTSFQGAEDDRCWMYFPDDDCPFYRVTNFHNYAPANVPGSDPGRAALMCETSYSEHKPEDLSRIMDRSIKGLDTVGLLAKNAEIESRFELDVEYGYPVPCLERDLALRTLQPWLEAQGIYSRGRFGGWKYEVANMDHSVMQGVEWAERMMQNTPEKTYSWN